MTDSVVLGDIGELFPADPKAVGYHLLSAYDFDDAQQQTAAIASLLLDGDRVQATHAGNRTHQLPILVIGTDRDDLSAKTDALLRQIAQPAYELTWTPDGGQPLVWDCFPGQADTEWNTIIETKGLARQITLTVPALPYGRSPDVEALTVGTLASTTRSRLYELTGILGSARSPLAADITWPSLQSAYVLHHPPSDADVEAPIAPAITSGQSVTVVGAEKLRGTYTVVAGVSSYGGAALETRVMYATITQSGVLVEVRRKYAVPDPITRLTPVVLGNVTLPLVDRPAGTALTLDIDVYHSGGTGTAVVADVLLLDTRGQTVMSLLPPPGATGIRRAWLDAPSALVAAGPVYDAATAARADAFAARGVRGEPRFTVSPDDEGSGLLVYAPQALPSAIAVTHEPRWLGERVA